MAKYTVTVAVYRDSLFLYKDELRPVDGFNTATEATYEAIAIERILSVADFNMEIVANEEEYRHVVMKDSRKGVILAYVIKMEKV